MAVPGAIRLAVLKSLGLLLGLFGCDASTPPPVTPAPSPPGWSTRARRTLGPSASPAVERWRRVGRVDVDGSSSGLPFAEAAEALQICAQARPCMVERWAREDLPTSSLLVLRRGDHLSVSSQAPTGLAPLPTPSRWRANWNVLSGSLPGCLGDPLATSPGDDPTALRSLEHTTAGWRWVLALSGQNRCTLSGELVLSAQRDGADASGLFCGGKAWQQGGRECAREKLRAYVRAQVQTRWPEMSLADRQNWLRILTQDPDAALLVEELRGLP